MKVSRGFPISLIYLGVVVAFYSFGFLGCSDDGDSNPACLTCPAEITPCATSWEKGESNPCMTGGFSGGSFDARLVRSASVLYDEDGSIYKMWYAGDDNSNPPQSRIGCATSLDGISWAACGSYAVVDLGSSGSFDDWHAYYPVVLKDGDTFKMWYTGDAYGRHYLGYATSPDGITWTKYFGSKYGGSILDWLDEGWNRYTEATCIIKDGSLYRMWFGEYGGGGGIGYATSNDGINWTIAGQVLPIGAPGGFDEFRIFRPSVAIKGSQHIMVYVGQNDAELQRFGLATSSDGITWQKYSNNPILPIGSTGEWDDFGHNAPCISFRGDVLNMWYVSSDGNTLTLGLASSDCSD